MSYQAFVSSTFVDLSRHRAHVIKTLRAHGFSVDPMEEWTSASDEPKVFSTRRIANCDLCILLVGWRRGHIPEGETRSITQIEYRYAVEHGIDVLPFLLDEDAAWQRKFDELDNDDELRKWRSELKERHGVGFFNARPTTIDVGPALTRWLSENQRDRNLRHYFEALRKWHGQIQFLGLPNLGELPDVPIQELFVSPFLSDKVISADQAEGDWTQRSEILPAITKERASVVLGDPGSGKSTLVNWVVWHLSAHDQNPWKTATDSQIPLPLTIRDLGLSPTTTWASLLDSFLGQPFARPLRGMNLEEEAANGNLFFLLDGLDEIPSIKTRRRLREIVWDALRRFPRTRWLMTSRIVGYHQVPFDVRRVRAQHDVNGHMMSVSRQDRLASCHYVAPFSSDQINSFALKWYRLRDSSELRAINGAEDLIAAIDRDASTTRLARTPHILTMMAIIHRTRARLPNGRALLYDDITKAYLETIDSYRRLPVWTDPLAEKRRWLARVGFEMQRKRAMPTSVKVKPSKNSKRSVSRDLQAGILATSHDVRQWVSEEMQRSQAGTIDANLVRDFVDYISRRSGLLVPRGEGIHAFVHLSFQEYFAARYLADHVTSPDWLLDANSVERASVSKEYLRQYASEGVWRETMVFLFELIAMESRRWLDTLADAIFDEDLCLRLTEDSGLDEDDLEVAVLLARLATDPHTGFGSPRRLEMIDLCCAAEAALQSEFEDDCSDILRTLMSDPEERTTVLARLVKQLKHRKSTWLTLSDTSVSDLSDIGLVTTLTNLYLSETKVTDLTPLASLKNLQELSLSGTGVSDVRVLGRLRNLRYINLSRTKVSDISCLSELAHLEVLDITDTSVSSVASIKRLPRLREIYHDLGFEADLPPA